MSRKLATLLFVDTTVYFGAMAAGVMYWAEYTIAYVEDRTAFGRILIRAGHMIAGLVTVIAAFNVFVPVLFTVDSDCVYHALPVRYVMLGGQILLLLLISYYAIASIVRRGTENRPKYRALAAFGLIMAAFLYIQLWYPYLPLYTIACMLGTCLLCVHPEDQAAFINAMNRQFLTEALDRSRVFEMIYRRIKSSASFYVRMKVSRMEDDNRYIVIGVTNIDDQMRQRREKKRMKKERTTYERIHALTGNFIAIYVVDPVSDRYREFGSAVGYDERFGQSQRTFTIPESSQSVILPHPLPA